MTAPAAPRGLTSDRLAPSKAVLLWVANLVSFVTPHSRMFGLRRRLFVAAGASIHAGARISGTVRIHHPNVRIGASSIGPGCQLMPSGVAPVVIGDRCAIAPDVLLNCHSHKIGDSRCRTGEGISSEINVGDGAWVGVRATFVCGASVGAGCVVGAGSLVRDAFADNLLIAGVPARVVRPLDH